MWWNNTEDTVDYNQILKNTINATNFFLYITKYNNKVFDLRHHIQKKFSDVKMESDLVYTIFPHKKRFKLDVKIIVVWTKTRTNIDWKPSHWSNQIICSHLPFSMFTKDISFGHLSVRLLIFNSMHNLGIETQRDWKIFSSMQSWQVIELGPVQTFQKLIGQTLCLHRNRHNFKSQAYHLCNWLFGAIQHSTSLVLLVYKSFC